MKKFFTLTFLFITILFTGCTSNEVLFKDKNSKKTNDTATYKLFENGISTEITDKEKIKLFEDNIKNIFNTEVNQFKSYITKENLDDLKKDKLLEITFSSPKSLSMENFNNGSKSFEFSTLYLYPNSKEGDNYSFIIKDKNKGFEGKEDIFHHLGTIFNYEDIFK
ncbi:MAG: hypothetical protein ACRDD2_08385 [Sarcina sp.]